MGWISELLKHLNTSRSFVLATFVTSITVLFGNNIFPNLIPKLPNEWQLFVIVGAVFSGTLLLFWIVPFLWKLIFRVFKVNVQKLSASNLSNDEIDFLLFLASVVDKGGNDYLDIDRQINYDLLTVGKLKTVEIVSSLCKKGLVKSSSFDRDLVFFTPNGRKKVLEIKNSQQ